MENKDIARRIIDKSTYLTLSTTDGKIPWANAVFFAADENYSLYFVSYNDSRHVQNILKNPNVAVAIFDSHSIPGQDVQGVQIQGTCQRVMGKDLPGAIDVVYTKRFPDQREREGHNLTVERFSKKDSDQRIDHIYKIIPAKIYILDKKAGKDIRVEVKMK